MLHGGSSRVTPLSTEFSSKSPDLNQDFKHLNQDFKHLKVQECLHLVLRFRAISLIHILTYLISITVLTRGHSQDHGPVVLNAVHMYSRRTPAPKRLHLKVSIQYDLPGWTFSTRLNPTDFNWILNGPTLIDQIAGLGANLRQVGSKTVGGYGRGRSE